MKTVSPVESTIQAEIRKALGLRPDLRLFRNNRGVGWLGKLEERIGSTVVLSNARAVEFGLTDGASDLIGPTQVVITPEMVGQTVALFTAIEVKRPRVAVPEHQRKFIDFVSAFGGLSGVARCPEDAEAIIQGRRA